MCARWQDNEALPSSSLSPDTSQIEIPVEEGSTGVREARACGTQGVVKAKAHHHDHATPPSVMEGLAGGHQDYFLITVTAKMAHGSMLPAAPECWKSGTTAVTSSSAA